MALGNPKRGKPSTASKGSKVVELTEDEWAEEIDRLVQKRRVEPNGWTLRMLAKRCNISYSSAKRLGKKMLESGDIEIVGTDVNGANYYREVKNGNS